MDEKRKIENRGKVQQGMQLNGRNKPSLDHKIQINWQRNREKCRQRGNCTGYRNA